MTIRSKNLGGHGLLGPLWLRLCSDARDLSLYCLNFSADANSCLRKIQQGFVLVCDFLPVAYGEL